MTQGLTYITSDCLKTKGGHFRPVIGSAVFDIETHRLISFLCWRVIFDNCPSRVGKIPANQDVWLNDTEKRKENKQQTKKMLKTELLFHVNSFTSPI
jgi:hypothetical protein